MGSFLEAVESQKLVLLAAHIAKDMDGNASIVRKLAEFDAEPHGASLDYGATAIVHYGAAALSRQLSRCRFQFIELANDRGFAIDLWGGQIAIGILGVLLIATTFIILATQKRLRAFQ